MMMKTVNGQGWRFPPRALVVAAACLLSAGPAGAFRAEKEAAAGGAPKAFAQAPAAKPPSPAQVLSAEQARAAGIQVNWNDRLGTPRSVRGPNLARPALPFKAQGAVQAGAAPEQRALAVLGALADLYAIRNAAEEFSPHPARRDAQGFQHVKLTQMHSGLRVIGGELIVHFNGQGEAYEVNGQYAAGIAVDVRAALRPEQALLAAQQDQRAPGHPPGAVMRGPELVVFAFQHSPRLAYELTLRGAAPSRWRYWIDAQNGDILLRFNDIKFAERPSNGSHTNLTGLRLEGEGGAAATIPGWYNTPNALYYLYNTNFQWIVSNAASSTSFTDHRSYAFRTTENWADSDRMEISAANNVHHIQQYYANVLARRSFDNSNSLINVNVHYGANYVNAFWNGVDITIGDGDGTEADSLAVLDVCTHEFAHAVTEYSANLYYYSEPGALNESFSDIFGALVEFASQPDGRTNYPGKVEGTADWLMGEDCWLSALALRDMRNPANTITVGDGNQQPSRYRGNYWYYGTGDNAGVHYNGGPQNFFFYLLCEGGSSVNDGIPYTVTGIGLSNAAQVAYLTLTAYLTQYSGYADAQDAWISAANLLNTNWTASVRQAWSAVGFTDTASASLGTAVNAPEQVWTTGGNSNWFSESAITHDGALAAQSGPISHWQMSKIYATVAGPATLSFWWKVSSEADYDFLSFSIDGVVQTEISGEVDWQAKSIAVGSGNHVLKWAYSKDGAVSSGYDAGWLDEVALLLPLMVTASSGAYEDRVALSWIPRSDATNYQIWRAVNVADSAQAVYLDETTAAAFNDATATAGVVYYYWIRAQTPSGLTPFNYYASGWRSWNYTPTGVTASDGAYTDKIHVAWTASVNAESYAVYRNTVATDSNAACIAGTADTAFDDTSAAAGATYYYWIRGTNAHGYSGFSVPDSGWRAIAPIPDPDSTNIPALRATDFDLSPAVMQMGAAPSQAVVRIVNTGAAATSAWVTMTLYLSSGGVFGSADNIGLGSVQRSVSLAAGQSSDIRLNSAERAALRVPSSVALGYYTAFLKATTTRPTATNNVLTLAHSVQIVASRLAHRDDFDNDGKTDLVIYNPNTGIWHIRGSAIGNEAEFLCGGPGYEPVSGDFDGDGKADLAAYQPAAGAWLFMLSGNVYNYALLEDFGGSGYEPVSGDFDGDGKADPALYNAGAGAWLVLLSGSGYASASAVIGSAGCKAVSGDFDGDGKADPAVYQPAGGEWRVMLSGAGYATVNAFFGDATFVPTAGDFDGDLKSDPALYRAGDGLWQVMLSAGNYAVAAAALGMTGFVKVAGDFDGDGKTDLAVYQSGYGYWYFRLSKTGYPVSSTHFGTSGFIPIDISD